MKALPKNAAAVVAFYEAELTHMGDKHHYGAAVRDTKALIDRVLRQYGHPARYGALTPHEHGATDMAHDYKAQIAAILAADPYISHEVIIDAAADALRAGDEAAAEALILARVHPAMRPQVRRMARAQVSG